MPTTNIRTETVSKPDLLGSGPRTFSELRDHIKRAQQEISDSFGPIERTDIYRVQAYHHDVIVLLTWALGRAIAIGASRE